MKILLCSPTLRVGGITKWTGYITEYFKNNPCDEVSLELFPMNNSVYLGDNASKLKRIMVGVPAYMKVVKLFAKVIKTDKPDLVHICTSASLGLIRDLMMIDICRKYSVKTCIHLHFGRTPELLNSNSWESRLFRKMISKANSVVVMNQPSYDSLTKHGYARVYNIPNPLAPSVVSLIEQCNAVRKDKKMVFVGHILKTKGVEELLSAMTQLTGFNLVLVGEDTMNLIPFLKEKYSLAFERNSIDFIGQQPHKRVIEEMKTGIFVFPSHTEGFPNVILEGMACGAPIIASDAGSMPEMISNSTNGPCGLIVPAKNSDSIVAAIRLYTDNPDFAILTGNNAQKKVHEQYNIHSVASQLISCWQNTLN